MNPFNKALATEMQCMCNPCCSRSNPVDFRDWVERTYHKEYKNMSFDVVYHGETLGHIIAIPIVGDHVFGYTVWRVDYDEKVVYVTK